MSYVINKAKISENMVKLMHQDVRVGEHVVGRVEEVHKVEDANQLYPNRYRLVVRPDNPFIKRSELLVHVEDPSVLVKEGEPAQLSTRACRYCHTPLTEGEGYVASLAGGTVQILYCDEDCADGHK